VRLDHVIMQIFFSAIMIQWFSISLV